MTHARIALANLPVPGSPKAAVTAAKQATLRAGEARADLVCFPECFVPGYRAMGPTVPAPDAEFLEDAWATMAEAAAEADVAVALGTERIVQDTLRISVLVIRRDGTRAGFQDKVQLDPTEDPIYAPGTGRQVFRIGALTMGVAICHEGFRYPETVRAAVLRGAQLVVHPHLSQAEPGSHRPSRYAEPANSFHEKAALCRAAENACFFATVNYASAGSPTTSAVVRPDGSLQCYQPYGTSGLLIADLALEQATGLFAKRYRGAENLSPQPASERAQP